MRDETNEEVDSRDVSMSVISDFQREKYTHKPVQKSCNIIVFTNNTIN